MLRRVYFIHLIGHPERTGSQSRRWFSRTGADICLAVVPTPQKAPWPPGIQVLEVVTLKFACKKNPLPKHFHWVHRQADCLGSWLLVSCSQTFYPDTFQFNEKFQQISKIYKTLQGAVEHFIQIPLGLPLVALIKAFVHIVPGRKTEFFLVSL